MKKVGLIVGHSPASPGATDPISGLTEFGVNTYIAHAVKFMNENPALKFEIIFRKSSYSALPGQVDELDTDLNISLHFNAFNKKAKGTLTLSSGSKNSLRFANILHPKMVKLFNTQDRGIKVIKKGERGSKILLETDAPTVLLEPFFIDNNLDFEKDPDILMDYAEIILCSTEKYFGL